MWLIRKVAQLLDWAFGLIWNTKSHGMRSYASEAGKAASAPLMIILTIALFLLIGVITFLTHIPDYWREAEAYANRSVMTVFVDPPMELEAVRVDLKREGFPPLTVFDRGEVVAPDFNRLGHNIFQVYYRDHLEAAFVQEKTDEASKSTYRIHLGETDGTVTVEVAIIGAFSQFEMLEVPKDP